MYDRERLLASVDLELLADEFLGTRKGTHASGMWACPDPQHAQTGRTPPVSVFRSRRGEQRWRCHGCGAGGTALDLVMAVARCDVRVAFDILARRSGTQPELAQPAQRPVAALARVLPGPDFAEYVTRCAERLWQRDGGLARAWLMDERALPPEVLRANAVGADPGPNRQPRPLGVPRAGPCVVLPVIEHGRPVYAQLRRLRPRPDQSKYLNVSGSLATNPKVARYRPVEQRRDSILVTEGPIDALSAAAAGYRAVAVLGATTADATVATHLASMQGRLVLAFDADPAGTAGTERLVRMLAELQRPVAVLNLPDGVNDLNDWMRAEGSQWGTSLAAAALPSPPVHSSLSIG